MQFLLTGLGPITVNDLQELDLKQKKKIAVVGLGYVGLPLAVEFGKRRSVIGFDIDQNRIEQLIEGRDSTLEVSATDLTAARRLKFTSAVNQISDCQIFIVTVPTPIDNKKRPDLDLLRSASALIGQVLKCGDIVIFESTVYPGCTEEECVPLLEKKSRLKYNHDFYCGYSPERINPGDRTHRLPNIRKVVSGSTPEIANEIDMLYREIIVAGTYKAESIQVAEAAKVIENTQRDLNIALVNELAQIFGVLGLDTEAVLKAAGTKWNFLPFRPGLVGGHCIGVDPYYLTYKAEAKGYRAEVVLAGRSMNDSMGSYVAGQLIKAMVQRDIEIAGAKVLIMGLTFKEDCPDVRNSKVFDVIRELKQFNADVDVYDPWYANANTLDSGEFNLIDEIPERSYDAIMIAVAHREFREMSINQIRKFGKTNHLVYDLKCVFTFGETDLRL